MVKQVETILEWEAPEFRHYPKNAAWFITFGIIVALLVIYEFVQKDWFGGLSVLIISGLFAAFAMHRPKEVIIRLTTHGLHIDDTNIPYDNIRQFWIVDNENHRTLNIETTAYLNHQLVIELNQQDPDEVQEILAELLPESDREQESPIQRIAHRFKF